MLGGFVKIPRSILIEDQWLKEPFTKGQAWLDLIMLANWEPGRITVQGLLVPVGRGEVGWSEGALADRWKWSVGKVRRFFDELEQHGRCSRKRYGQRDRRKSVLSICDYDQYSGDNRQDGIGDDMGNGIGDGIGIKKLRKKEVSLRKSASESNRFDEFWKSYPRKKSKVDASKAWKQVKGESIFDEIMAGLQRAVNSPDWLKDKGQFIPYPASWLRAGGWLDESGTNAPAECKTCRHFGDQCKGKDETCSAYSEVIA